MKTRSILTAAVLTASLFSFNSCGKEGDTTKPVINLIAPAEGATIAAGSDIHLDMELSDDVALASYKIDIHSAAGHEHKAHHEGEHIEYSLQQTWNDIDGKRNAEVHHHEIIIPANAELGEYHFIVFCTDQAGNESMVVSEIIIAETGEEQGHDEH